MLSSFFFRISRLMIISIICSLSIYFGYVSFITDKGILFLSFLAFIVITGIDTYRFSFDFWGMQDYYIGLLLPLVAYGIMGFMARFLFKPIVFNRIFLPLRFAGCFGVGTDKSIIIMSIAILAIMTVLRFLGASAGRRFVGWENEEN